MSVAVSPMNGGKRFNRVYAGTEPSALYISNDGGDSWERLEALNDLPSSKTWSFPPRPWTHHVRWIEPDATNPDYLFVAIEAGALVQSHNGGKTWIDRVKGGPYDTHTLCTHPKAPKRLFSSAGDGYFESFDYGETWSKAIEGLRHGYLVGIAVDFGNPDAVVVSASNGPFRSFSSDDAETYLYRKDLNNGNDWKASGETGTRSISIEPPCTPESAPSGPNITSPWALSSLTLAITIWQPGARSLGVWATCAPRCPTSWDFSFGTIIYSHLVTGVEQPLGHMTTHVPHADESNAWFQMVVFHTHHNTSPSSEILSQ